MLPATRKTASILAVAKSASNGMTHDRNAVTHLQDRLDRADEGDERGTHNARQPVIWRLLVQRPRVVCRLGA